MQKITTTLVHNASGRANVLAKGMGKQRTVAYNHALSHETNHAHAAAEVANLFGWRKRDDLSHETTDSGKHIFINHDR